MEQTAEFSPLNQGDNNILPVTTHDLKKNKCNANCNKIDCTLCERCIKSECWCVLVAFTIICLIVYWIYYKIFIEEEECDDIPISLKNFTIVCDTWDGENHPCQWNDKWCTIDEPCVLSCKDYIRFNAGCTHSDCGKRGRYDWCHDQPFDGQGGYIPGYN